MERRKALKNMALGLGHVVATPTLVGIVQSCKEQAAFKWTPDFFSEEEGPVLKRLVDVILPKTDIPSASEVQVHLFIDKFVNKVMDKAQQHLIRTSMQRFLKKALKESGTKKVDELTIANLEPVIAEALSVSKEEEMRYLDSIERYKETIAKNKQVALNDHISHFAFANILRELTIFGYKSSEYIGEKILAYLPVPGGYVACGNMQELTQGKAWSL